MAGLSDKQASLYAGVSDKQASLYAAARPDYPPSLISFLASLTSHHGRAWDVGTGSGQAAIAIAEHYERVIATDVSEAQLKQAQKRENVTYVCTPAEMSEEDLQRIVGGEGSVDLVTVAQALHWFDHDSFYAHVKHVLRKPGGILAAWCYTAPSVSKEVDALFSEFDKETGSFWGGPAKRAVDEEYRNLAFPFTPVLDDVDGTGPIRFETKKEMRVDGFLAYLGSWSVLQRGRSRGVELLDESRQDAFRAAWGEEIRTVTWPVYLRVGRV